MINKSKQINIFNKYTPFSLRYSTLYPFCAICFRLRCDFTLKLHTTLLIVISITGSSLGVSFTSSIGSALFNPFFTQSPKPLLASLRYTSAESLLLDSSVRGTRLVAAFPLDKTDPWSVMAIPSREPQLQSNHKKLYY